MRTTTRFARPALLSMLLVVCAGLATGMTGCPTDGTGDGNDFARSLVTSSTAGGATAVAAGNFDGDALWDLASVWKDEGAIRLHMQQQSSGQATWTNVTLLTGSLAAGAQAIAVVDINKDNRPDIFVGTDQGRILYLRQTGSSPADLGNWNISVIGTSQGTSLGSWSSLAAADVDADGFFEIFASLESPGGRISIFDPPLVPVDGSGWTRVDIITSGRSGALQVLPIDMDGDGDADVITSAANEGSDSIAWYANPGPNVAFESGWTRYAIGHVADPRKMAFGYVDADAFIDLVVTSGLGRSVSWFQAPTTLADLQDQTKRWSGYPVGTLGTDQGGGLAVADYDGDGADEIFVGTVGTGRLSMFEAVLGAWTETVIDETGGDYSDMLAGDIDGDGNPDLVATIDESTGELLWYRQE